MNYQDVIAKKSFTQNDAGFTTEKINLPLFDFQSDCAKWALAKGKAAIFADTGLGKTAMQLEWAYQVHKKHGKPVMILAPLCVAHQTVREANKFGLSVNYCRKQEDSINGINITNYEMMHNFEIDSYIGVVLDESSILKSMTGRTRTELIESCRNVPYRLSCTATPSPNDYMELGNQAEFLGIMTANEMLAMFFTHDSGETSKWRLKGHGKTKFYEWLSTWALYIRKPSDLGYADDSYDLPPLNIIRHVVQSPIEEGQLISTMEDGIRGRIKARRASMNQRINKVVELVSASSNPFVIWCELNDESSSLAKLIESAKEVKGSDTSDIKEAKLNAFSDKQLQGIITKPSIAGFGLNWQHCDEMIFCGISDSWESYYQAIRRCYRYGQKNPVNVHIIYSEAEEPVMQNILRKDKMNSQIIDEMAKQMKSFTMQAIKKTSIEKSSYKRDTTTMDSWRIELGDCVDVLSNEPNDSIHYSIFSPPFSSLYVWSNSDYDMGNNSDDDGFYNQFKFFVKELYRTIKPGRLVSFHCMNLPVSKQRDGFIGIKDFRGDLIRMFANEGFIYHSEVVIWKDPVIAMQRTKALGLLHKQIKKDSSMSRQGISDYLVTMRKPGDNAEPISHTNETFPVHVWQKYASPVWMDINPSDTLQFREARENDDERHICPLQLGVIQRAMELWSNPNDVILSPFAGIGSEGYVALQMGRKFLGIELKESYYKLACRNLDSATRQRTLFPSDIESSMK